MKHCELDVIDDAQIDIGIKSISIDDDKYAVNSMEVLVKQNGDIYLIDGIIWDKETWVFYDSREPLKNLIAVQKNIKRSRREGRQVNLLDYALFPLREYDTTVSQVVLYQSNQKLIIVDFEQAFKDDGYLLIILNCKDIVKLYKYNYKALKE